jgi:hypothetical protein
MPRPNTVWLAWCAILVAFSATPVSRAQDPGTRARELFLEGREDINRGDIEEGCRKVLESHRLAPEALGPLLNVADCDERAGRIATAWRGFTKAASTDTERRDYALERAAALEERVPRLILELPEDAPAEAKVTQDGVALDPSALQSPLALDPGSYRFVISAPKRRDRAYDVEMRERMTQRISLRLGDPLPLPSPSPSPKPPPHRPTVAPDDGLSGQALAGWITGGVGVASLIVGIVTGALVAVHASVYDDHCDDEGVCDDEGLQAASAGKPLAIVSPITLGVGIAAIGVAIPLLVTSPEMSAGATVVVRGAF